VTFLDYLAALLLSELPADYDPETDLCEPSPAPSSAGRRVVPHE